MAAACIRRNVACRGLQPPISLMSITAYSFSRGRLAGSALTKPTTAKGRWAPYSGPSRQSAQQSLVGTLPADKALGERHGEVSRRERGFELPCQAFRQPRPSQPAPGAPHTLRQVTLAICWKDTITPPVLEAHLRMPVLRVVGAMVGAGISLPSRSSSPMWSRVRSTNAARAPGSRNVVAA